MALAFVLAQLPIAANAWVLIGAVAGQLPFGRCLALETSNTFTTLVGGEVAAFAVRVLVITGGAAPDPGGGRNYCLAVS